MRNSKKAKKAKKAIKVREAEKAEDEPLSPPCSAVEAKFGLPTIVQLHLVDDGLEQNPLPREDFYRQYSPKRPSPKIVHTPLPDIYTHEETLRMSKDFAMKVANGLKQFHAGRVMLRREEAEQHGDLEQDPDYWDRKVAQMEDFAEELFLEVDKRKEKELKGEAKEGYAREMLLSPTGSPSRAPLDRGLSEVTEQSKPSSATRDGSPPINRRPSQPHAGPSQEPLQSPPENNRDDPPTPLKGQKRTRSEVQDQEKSPAHTNRNKRQRREVATAQQKQEPVSVIKSTQGPERLIPSVPRTKPHETPKRKGLSPKPRSAQPTIPWDLRPRNRISYRETGSGTNMGNRSRRGKRTACQTKPRGHAKRSHG